MIVGRAEARGRQFGLQDDTEQQDVEAPGEDACQHGGGELVLSRGPGEPGPGGRIANQPDDQHAQPVQYGETHQVGDRPHTVLGPGVCRQLRAEPMKKQAQDGLGRDGGHRHGAQKQQERRWPAAAFRLLVEKARNAREFNAKRGQRIDDLDRTIDEGRKRIGPRLRFDANDLGRRRRLRLGWGRCGRRGGSRRLRAFSLQLLRNGIADRIDQRIELLLREAGGWRCCCLSLCRNAQPKGKRQRQCECAKSVHDLNPSLAHVPFSPYSPPFTPLMYVFEP